MSGFNIINLKENQHLKQIAAKWFSEKWKIDQQAYLDSIEESFNTKAVPSWYLCFKDDEIAGGIGVIENDFHARKDLRPNVCAVYVEKKYRCYGIAGRMLDHVCKDMAKKGIEVLYLLTDHDSFYEKYGWHYYCDVLEDGGGSSRLYQHQQYNKPQKIMVIGCPGSGKSRLSKILAQKYSIPIVHLDLLHWNKDKTEKTKEQFDELLEKELAKDCWILDGNYARTLEKRMRLADTIIYLDFPLEQSLQGVKERMGAVREDLPWVEEAWDEEFEQYIRDFQSLGKEKIQRLLEKYDYKRIIVLKSREETNDFVDELERNHCL